MMKCFLIIAFLFPLNSFILGQPCTDSAPPGSSPSPQKAADQPTVQETLLKGFTLQLGNDGKYNILPGVNIRAYREGPIGKPTVSADDGSFSINVKVGEPFKVLFYATVDRVPELQQLAGVGAQDFIVIALLTVDQEQVLARSHIVPEAKEKLNCILPQLPEGNDPGYQAVRNVLNNTK
jgi:hypothetical protein